MRGQAGGVAEIGVTLVIAATILIVGLLVFSNINDAIPQFTVIVNESVGTGEGDQVVAGQTLTSACNPIRSAATTILYNATDIIPTNNYTLWTDTGTINISDSGAGVNWTGALTLDYTCTYDRTEVEQATMDNISNTTLDAYDLAVVGLIVLAAVAVLGYIFLFRTGGG